MELTMEEQGRKPYHCSICGKDFTLSVTFKAHTVLHERETPYKCSWCGEVFVKNSLALKDHMRRHLDNWELSKKRNDNGTEQNPEDLDFTCKICTKTLSSHYNLARHLRGHTGEKPFHCDVCTRKYMSKDSLKIHMKRRHSKEETVYICEFCGEEYKSKSSLARHSRKHKNEVEHKCEECGKKYRSKKVLDNHKKTHNAEKAKATYRDNNSDVSKIRVFVNPIEEDPTGNVVEKKYTCSSCGKQLTSHKSVLNHMLVHAETALHSCQVCGIAFSNKANLAKHAEKHSNYNKAVESRNLVCEAIESQEKITLYIKNDQTITKPNNDRKVFMLEGGGFHFDPQIANHKREKAEGNKREDVMVINEDVVIDVEEVIIADKDDDDMDSDGMLDPLV